MAGRSTGLLLHLLSRHRILQIVDQALSPLSPRPHQQWLISDRVRQRGSDMSLSGSHPPLIGIRREFFDWVFEGIEFQAWSTGQPSWQLRCIGGPGAGKVRHLFIHQLSFHLNLRLSQRADYVLRRPCRAPSWARKARQYPGCERLCSRLST